MLTRIKVFGEGDSKDLEKEMNKWLEKNDGICIIDIKFQVARNERNKSYAAMIQYTE